MAVTFQPIDFNQQKQYIDLLATCQQPSSDYSFINLYAWQEAYGLEWAWTDSLVWIRQNNPVQRLWAPIGDWESIDWQGALQALESHTLAFDRVPEKLALLWQDALGDKVEITEDRDQWDYVYSVPELIALAGKKYHKKKNHFNKFKKSYSFEYHPMTTSNAQEALKLQDAWCQWRDCESVESLSKENQGIYKVLDNWESLDSVMGGMIYVEGELAAYTISEALSPDMLLIHFEKGSPEFKGSYQAINQQFLAHHGEGYALVNREQDTGDEGLRKAKMTYHPVDFIKKFKAAVRLS